MCDAHNAWGAGPLVCTRPDPHATGHTFAATWGVNTPPSEPSGHKEG